MSTSTNSLIQSGAGGLPKIVLAADDGARAEIYLHGAHVTPGFQQTAAKHCSSVPKLNFSLVGPSAAACRSSFRSLVGWEIFPRMALPAQ